MVKKTPRIVLRPCQGDRSRNIPRGHLYRVLVLKESGDAEKDLGVMTLESAKTAYPSSQIQQSDTICPDCAKIFTKQTSKQRDDM